MMTLDAAFQTGVARHREGRIAEAETIYKSVLSRDPSHARATGMLGAVALQRADWTAAVDLLHRSLALDPANASDHANLGMALYHLGEFDRAFESLDRAVTLDPANADAWSNRGIALKALSRYGEAIHSFDRAIALNPRLLTAHMNRASGLGDMKRHDEALAGFTDALRLDPDHAATHLRLGGSLLSLGEYEDGWWHYEWRKRLERPSGGAGFVCPEWTGTEDLRGKRLFVHREGGFGDVIQCCRYLPLLLDRGAEVTITVQTELMPLIEAMDSGLQVLGGFASPEIADYHCATMSLPALFGTTLETIPSPGPYLRSDPVRRAVWRERLASLSGIRAGLVWSSGVSRQIPEYKTALARRSIPLPELGPLGNVRGVSFVQLQKGLPPGPDLDPPPGLVLHDWTTELTDFAETAALMDELDLVITVDTAAAHLAGALGKPVWVLLWYNADWRWLEDRSDSPWYQSARLFRQAKMGAWKPVVQAVCAALEDLSQATRSSPVPE